VVSLLPLRVGALAAAAVVVWTLTPPGFLKPSWLRQRERSTQAGGPWLEVGVWVVVAYPIAGVLAIMGSVALMMWLANL
jgi:hypothetical protein